jgi:hypothetical protein
MPEVVRALVLFAAAGLAEIGGVSAEKQVGQAPR